MAENILTLTDANFDAEVVKSTIPVLVDFWAPWCGPCRQIAPIVEQLATEYAGRVKIAKYNCDDHQAVAQKFDIRGIPALLVFNAGAVAESIVGAVPKSQIVAKLDRVLG